MNKEIKLCIKFVFELPGSQREEEVRIIVQVLEIILLVTLACKWVGDPASHLPAVCLSPNLYGLYLAMLPGYRKEG